MFPTFMKKKKAEHLVRHIKKNIFNRAMSNIKNIDCIRQSNQLFIDFENEKGPRCDISHQIIFINTRRTDYPCGNYIYESDNIIVSPQARFPEFSEMYKNENPEMFAILLYILQNRENVFRIIEEATYLYKHTNYYENIISLAKEFLLCNHITKIFPRGVDKIIFNKILFFVFKKIEKKNISKRNEVGRSD